MNALFEFGKDKITIPGKWACKVKTKADRSLGKNEARQLVKNF